MDFENQNQILSAVKSRIEAYYLNPARVLNDLQHAFATGVILVTAIDALTYYSIGGNDRIKDFVRQIDLPQFNGEEKKRIVKGFDDYFRNGLIHEGRIKSCGQFSYDYSRLVMFEDNFIVVNPNLLLAEVDSYFRKYLSQLTEDTGSYSVFITKLKRQFKSDTDQMKAL